MASVDKKIHGIIHVTSLTAAAVGAGMAQSPLPDSIVLTALQTKMVVKIAGIYGVSVSKGDAGLLVLEFSTTLIGKGIARQLIKKFPLIGNISNAATAASVTEAIGWSANAYFNSAA